MPPRAFWRTAFWVAVLLLAVVVFSLPWILPPLVERAAVAILQRSGLENVALEVERIGLSGSRIIDVRLGRAPDVLIHELEVDYSAGGLLRGRLARVRVTGVEVRSTLGPNGLSFGDLDALLKSDETSAPSETTLPPILPDRIEIEDVYLNIASPGGAFRLSGRLAGRLTERGLAALEVHAALEHEADVVAGEVSIALAEGGALDLTVRLEAAKLEAPVSVDAAHLELTGRGQLPPLERILEGPALAEWIASSEFRGEIEGGWSRLSLEGLPTHDVRLELDFDIHAGTLSAEVARLEFALAETPPFVASLKLRATAPDPERLSIDEATLRWQPWNFEGRRIGAGRIAMTGQGTPDVFDATLEMAAVLHGGWLPDVNLVDGNVSLEAALRLSQEALTIRIPDCVRISAGAGSLLFGLRLAERHELCIRQTRDPGLTLQLTEAGSVADRDVTVQPTPLPIDVALSVQPTPLPIDVALSVQPTPLAIDLALSVQPTPLAIDLEGAPVVRGTTPVLRFAGHVEGERWTSTVETEGGLLRLPRAALAFEGIRATLHAEGQGVAFEQRSKLRVEQIRHTEAVPVVNAFSLDAKASGDADRVAFEARIRDATGLISLRANGTHRFASGKGSARIGIDRIVLSEGGAGLGDLSPRLRGIVEAASGDVVGSGEVSWSEQGLDSSLELTVQALSLESIYVTLENAAGVVRLDKLWPPISAPRQRLTFDRLEAGIPLTDGVVVFQIVPDFRLEVLEAVGQIAHGSVAAEGVVDLERDEQRFVLRAQKIDLGTLLLLAEMEGLEVTGTLQGELPLVFEEGGVVVREGLLAAAPGGGVIRYRGTAGAALGAAGEYGELVTRALEDFHYRELSLRVNGGAGTELETVLRLRGSNPALEDGRPIDLTLRLSGDLGGVLEDYFWSLRLGEVLTDGVRKALEEKIRSQNAGEGMRKILKERIRRQNPGK